MASTQSITANQLTGLSLNMTAKTRWMLALAFPLVVGPIWYLAWSGRSVWNGHGARVGTLAGLVLLATLITSAITDFQRHRIHNWTTYPAFLWAVAINLIASTYTYGSESMMPAFAPAGIIGPHALGGVGIGECLLGALACFFITLFGYDLSGGGAGDVKLATVIGAMLGLHEGIFAVAYSYVVAAIAIIVWSTWKHGPMALVKAAARAIGRVLGPLWPYRATSDDDKLLLTPVPLGPYFAIGTLLVLLELVPT